MGATQSNASHAGASAPGSGVPQLSFTSAQSIVSSHEPADIEDQFPLIEAMSAAKDWAVALIRVADPASRLALFQTNSALHQWVLEAAPQVSVTLRGGHSEAVLQKRLAYAAQALARRGRDSKLVFHIPTPNFQALQSLLGLPEAAGRAATELDVVLSELLELPDPRGGVYDVRLSVLIADCKKFTPEMSQELMDRLPHWRFVMGKEQCTLYIRARKNPSPDDQPAALRSILASLSSITWHATSDDQVLEVSLDDWTLTPALIQELRRLPEPAVPVRLMFRNCVWLWDVDYSQLPGLVPTCYAKWRVWYYEQGPVEGRYTAEHIVDVCRGAQARERGAKKLTIASGAHYFSEEEKSWVEGEMDEQGLWRWVKDIQWGRDSRDDY